MRKSDIDRHLESLPVGRVVWALHRHFGWIAAFCFGLLTAIAVLASFDSRIHCSVMSKLAVIVVSATLTISCCILQMRLVSPWMESNAALVRRRIHYVSLWGIVISLVVGTVQALLNDA